MSESSKVIKLPFPFVMRRLHSLLGLWLAIYLFEHLLVNSQMALYFQDDGSSFIKMVNKIHAMPFLKVIEVLVLGLPFLLHGLWGIHYAVTSKTNSHRSSGVKPSLPQYPRNRAFTWQRITSWLLLIGIIGHVAQMRFIDYPKLIHDGQTKHYLFTVKDNPYLLMVVAKVQAQSFTPEELQIKAEEIKNEYSDVATDSDNYTVLNEYEEKMQWLRGAETIKVKKGRVLIDAPSAGSAFFIIVRETFKSPLMVILYSIFVIAAAFHGFNGLWTFLITWGIALTERAQARIRVVTTGLMWVVMFLGLMSIWGTYWTIQFQG